MNESIYKPYSDIFNDFNGPDPERDYSNIFHAEFLKSRDEGSLIPYLSLKCVLALISRVGFLLIQVGSVPVENIYAIVVYHVAEISVAILSYGVLGNLIAFGSDTAAGWISKDHWKWDDVSSMTKDLDGALIGICGVLVATAQMSSFLVGRTSFLGGMLLTAFYCAIFQPFLMHWIWHQRGWMKHSKFLGRYVSVQDQAGALALHIPSVLFGAIGSLFLGRRILKLRDVDDLSFGTENAVSTLIGYLLIIFNYIVFALPMYTLSNDYSALTIINSVLALGGDKMLQSNIFHRKPIPGIFTVTLLQRVIFKDISHHRRILRSVQGGVAALISISAAVNLYSPSVAIIISLVASAFFFFFAEVVNNTALEDPCSFVSSHLVCGFLGVMLCSLLARRGNLGDTVTAETLGVHLMWQFICAFVVICFSVVFALLLFLLMRVLGILRDKSEVANHRRAAVLGNALSKRAFLERLFTVNATTSYVVPGYERSYFGPGRVPGGKGSVNVGDVSRSDREKTGKNTTFQEGGTGVKEFDSSSVQVDVERKPSNPNLNHKTYASGDHESFLERKDSSKLEVSE